MAAAAAVCLTGCGRGIPTRPPQQPAEGPAEKPVAKAPTLLQAPIVLLAKDAEVHGSTMVYESKGVKDNIGFWRDAKDWCGWKFVVSQPGEFVVKLSFACTDKDAGSKYIVTVADQKFGGVVESTGSWDEYATKILGTVRLTKPGTYVLAVRADGEPKVRAVMNVKSITLEPAQK